MQGPAGQLEFDFDISTIGKILRRRIWWLLVPPAVGGVVSLALALLLPPVYEGTTMVLIEPQGIPEQLVPTTVVADKEARFFNIRLQILSRDNLTQVIDDLDLYPGVVLPREELIARMRESIGIEPIMPTIVDPRRALEINSFAISFRDSDPRHAAIASNRLARDFIRENIEGRTSDAEGTSEFIAAEIERQTQKLHRLAAGVIAFKESHLGELPEQLDANRSNLERRAFSVSQKREGLRAARTQVNLIGRQLEELRASGGSAEDDPVRRRSEVELGLNVLRSRGFTERHPDVVAGQAELVELERMITASQEGEVSRSLSPMEAGLRREYRNYEVSVNVFEAELKNLAKEVATYEGRIENTPRRAAELGALESEYRAVSESLKVLDLKKADADIGRSMEAKQKGERFRIIESAEVPESPVSPNRPLMLLLGIGLGALIGLGGAVAAEAADSRFYLAADIETSLALPVLVSVPVIRLPSEIAAARARIRRMLWSVAGVCVLAAGGALLYYFAGLGNSAPDSLLPPAEERVGDV